MAGGNNVEGTCRARRKRGVLENGRVIKKIDVGNMCRKGVKLLHCGDAPLYLMDIHTVGVVKFSTRVSPF